MNMTLRCYAQKRKKYAKMLKTEKSHHTITLGTYYIHIEKKSNFLWSVDMSHIYSRLLIKPIQSMLMCIHQINGFL